jgi:predicted metal-binding membrane protein
MSSAAPDSKPILPGASHGFDFGLSKRLSLPAPAWALIGAFIAVIVLAWLLTITTANNLFQLLGAQLGGATPVDRLVFLGLVGVMMVAMMLPSALPMLTVFQRLSAASATKSEASLRSVLFSTSYFLAWSISMALALIVLMGLGLMGTLALPYIILPGLLLVGAGVYQFTYWKQYCLTHCRTPVGFLMTHWRAGRWGALRMGLDHSLFCIGCCWLLMAVVFVTGAMSLLWMAAFSGLILVEKTWNPGQWFSRAVGGTAIVVGGALAALSVVPLP